MQAQKTDTKVVLLFVPKELSGNFNVIQSLHIHKSVKGITYEAAAISRKELRNHYTQLPENAIGAIIPFQPEAISEVQQALEQKFRKQRAGISSNQLLHNAMMRHLYQLFHNLKPFYSQIKWYHKKQQPGGKNCITAPCVFNTEKLSLRFEVKKENQRFFLEPQVVWKDIAWALKEFNRHYFLLENNNEYFLLSLKDYQTLQWLEQNDTEAYCTDPDAFSHHILARLDAEYPVNRNNLFEEKAVATVPVSRVLLSELNNTFLMFTPQWIYDGIVVEGPWKETFDTTAGGEKIVVSRHKDAEKNTLLVLESLHPNFAGQRNGYYYLSFAEAQKQQWFLKAFYSLLDNNLEVAGMDLLQHFRYSTSRVQTTAKIIKEKGNLVLLHMSTWFGTEEIPLIILQKTLHAGQRAVLLKNGSLGILSEDWMLQYGALIKHGNIRADEVEVPRFMAISEHQLPEEQQVLKPLLKEDWWKKWQQWQNDSGVVYAVPAVVKAQLRPYQQKGFEWLALLAEAGAGACLADDMGLGKTLQTICFLAWYMQQEREAVHIIVCPASLIYNWQQELQKFAPGIRAVVYHGALRDAQELQETGARVIITSYGTLRADKDVLLSKNYGAAVIDESHNIKNPSAQITLTIRFLKATMRIALSGTPVVNNTFDLYAQLDFALPGMLGSQPFFKREYADAIDRFHDEEKIRALQKLTAPFILRRSKEQVAEDLPAKTESILWCKMSNSQYDLYNRVKDQIRSNLFTGGENNGLQKRKLAVLQGLLKLRQVCNHPALLPEEEQQGHTCSVKTEVLMEELVRLIPGHKVLVFSQFSSMLHLLKEKCCEKGLPYFLLDGQTPAEKRLEMVNRFQQEEEGPHLFFISLKAGNTGLTLTAADYVFLFDPWWNTATEQQAIDRTHRIGQTRNVFAYKMICRNTIEEKIIDMQQRKKYLAGELITEEEGFVKSLTEEDIVYLFS